MGNKALKNIVVIKNLPSNLVEEAIVVLKCNKVKLPEHIEKKNDSVSNKKPDDYILKEAELVISNYISKIENKKGSEKKNTNLIEKKYKRLKFISILLLVSVLLTAIF